MSKVKRVETSASTEQKSGRPFRFKRTETDPEKKKKKKSFGQGLLAFFCNLHKRKKNKSKSAKAKQVEWLDEGGDAPVSSGGVTQSYREGYRTEYPIIVESEQYGESSDAPQSSAADIIDGVSSNQDEEIAQSVDVNVTKIEVHKTAANADDADDWDLVRWARSLSLASVDKEMPSYKQVGTEWETSNVVSYAFMTRVSDHREEGEEAGVASIKGPDAISSCHSELVVPVSQTAVECVSIWSNELGSIWSGELGSTVLISETACSDSSVEETSLTTATSDSESESESELETETDGTETETTESRTKSKSIALVMPFQEMLMLETVPLVEDSEDNVSLKSGVMSEIADPSSGLHVV